MKFVIKIGTNLLTNEDNSLNTGFISTIVDQLAVLQREGHEPVVVTSGAVAAGRKSLSLKKESKHIPYRQALASVGQTYLLDTYRDQFARYDIVIGQVLLTMADFEQRKNFLSTRNTLSLMLELGVVPIINENDVTTFDELKFGDNDNLSAHVASLMSAETLILLTDVDGLYNDDPRSNPDAQCIASVDKVTAKIQAMAKESASRKALGGMQSKLKAAEYATEAGITVWITRGTIPNVIRELVSGEAHHGTCFKAQFTARESRRKWLQTKKKAGAVLVVDAGATKALSRGSSLLPSGIMSLKGSFERGEVVEIEDEEGTKRGFGQVNYGSEEIAKIKGHQSSDIASLLGYGMEDEVIHRENLVV